MFSVIQGNLFQVMMLLNCIVVVPDLDLGREIKYSGTFHFLCPCRQNVGLAASTASLHILSSLLSQIIIPFNTV
jgi:hypothetical protein